MIRLFYSYAHEDEPLRDELDKHLSALEREGAISEWHDRRINPGQAWEPEIERELNEAQIILLLLSADFLASDYCWKEVEIALRRQAAGDARVIPVILRPCDWSGAIQCLQALPRDGRPVTSWSNHDAAFLDVAQGIRRAATELRGERQAEDRRPSQPIPQPPPLPNPWWRNPVIIAALVTALGAVAAAFVPPLFNGPEPVGPAPPSVYQVRATVLEDGAPTDDAEVWSSLGGEPKKVAGGWQFDIPAGNVSADREITFHAKRQDTSLQGTTVHRLTNDSHQTLEINLERDRAGLAGRVQDSAGNGIADAKVFAGMGTEVTDANGRFRFEPQWADGERVRVHIEGPGYAPANRWHMAGDRPVDEMTITLKPAP